jgi:hypothetical protein
MRAPTTTWIVTRAFLAMPRWFKRWLVGVVTDAVDADEKVDCAAYDELE